MAADLHGFFLNCFIEGETFGVEQNGRVYRDTTELSLGRRSIKIVQSPEILRERAQKFRGEAVYTTTIVVRDVEAAERAEVGEMLTGLSFLLSFATSSQVAFYGWSHEEEPRLSERWATVAHTGFIRPVFDLHSGETVRKYLESTWQKYQRLEESRQLRAAIDLYVLSETRSLPDELKLATMFILLENLKSTFASEQGYNFVNEFYIKPSGDRWSFRGLLEEMLQDVGISAADLQAIVNLRNEIIHSGIS